MNKSAQGIVVRNGLMAETTMRMAGGGDAI